VFFSHKKKLDYFPGLPKALCFFIVALAFVFTIFKEKKKASAQITAHSKKNKGAEKVIVEIFLPSRLESIQTVY